MESSYVTIREVAADAHVSTATVSRVLNEPWRVNAQTLARVRSSIDKLGYRPNLRARLLALGTSGTICFLLSNRPFIHSVHAQILQGTAIEADLRHIQIVYASCSYLPDTPPSEIALPKIIAARGLVDGVIVAGTNYPNILKALDELGAPYVVFGTNLISDSLKPTANAVYVDDENGGFQATTHLISLGHRQIIFIGDISMPWYRRRYEGYCRAMRGAGLDASEPVGSISRGEFEMGYDAVNELCDAGRAFSALFVGGDMGAMGAMRALDNRGLTVPERVSVVGFNDEELVAIAHPPLTTVRVPKEEVGARCVRILNEKIAGAMAKSEPVVLPIELVLRDSTTSAKQTVFTNNA